MNIQIEQQPLPVAGGAAVGTPDSKSSLVAVLSLLKPLVMWPLRFLRAVVVVLSRPVLQFLWALVWPFVVLARCFYALLMLPLDLVLKFEVSDSVALFIIRHQYHITSLQFKDTYVHLNQSAHFINSSDVEHPSNVII